MLIHPLQRGIYKLISAGADLLCGATCPGCDLPGLWLCQTCHDLLLRPPLRVTRDVTVPLVAAAPYRPVLAQAIPRYKNDGALHLDRLLGGLLGKAVSALEPPPSAHLVPVPSLKQAVRARGYDHAYRLARVAARQCDLKVSRGLIRLDVGRSQRGLARVERATNLARSMYAQERLSDVIVVDDIVTTGASLAEAIRALETVGSDIIGAAVVGNA